MSRLDYCLIGCSVLEVPTMFLKVELDMHIRVPIESVFEQAFVLSGPSHDCMPCSRGERRFGGIKPIMKNLMDNSTRR